MLTQRFAEKNSPAAVVPEIRPSMPWRVVSARVLPEFRLEVEFFDGLRGTVDMRRLIHSPGAGVFARLADSEVFAQAHLVHGAVSWPGELDLAPDAMHAAIAKNGMCVLG